MSLRPTEQSLPPQIDAPLPRRMRGHSSSAGGGNNTNSPPAWRAVKGKNWIWTWNNYDSSTADGFLATHLKALGAIGYVYGREIAPTTGTPHLQGYVEFKSDRRLGTIYDRIVMEGGPQVWRRRARNATRQHNLAYCSKDNKATVWSAKNDWKIPERIFDPMSLHKWYQWQINVRDAVTRDPYPFGRQIIFIWSLHGAVGKSSLAKSLIINGKPHEVLYLGGKGGDVKCGIVLNHKEHGVWPKLVIFNAPRNGAQYVSWGALEQIKDGMFFSGKYESGMALFNSPHIIVFANEQPPYEKLSKDRWLVFNVDDEKADVDLSNYDQPKVMGELVPPLALRMPGQLPTRLEDLTNDFTVNPFPRGGGGPREIQSLGIIGDRGGQEPTGPQSGEYTHGQQDKHPCVDLLASEDLWEDMGEPGWLTPTQKIDDEISDIELDNHGDELEDRAPSPSFTNMPRFDLPQFDSDGDI